MHSRLVTHASLFKSSRGACGRAVEVGEQPVALERSEAVVLRGVDFSQSSRIVTFLCPERGRMACMAKGAKRHKTGTAALLDTFHRLEIVYSWKASRGVQQLTDCTMLNAYTNIREDLEKSMCAAIPLEIASFVAHENEPSENLYHALIAGLEGLDTWTHNIRAHCAWFTLRLLTAAGFAPAVDTCCNCGSLVSDTPGFAYAGGVTCTQCASDYRLSAPTYAALIAYSNAPDTCPTHPEEHDLFDILPRFAATQLDRTLKSVRVLDQMFPASQVKS